MSRIILAFPLLVLPALSLANEKCPITGKPVDKNVSLDVNGKEVNFCCEKCIDAYKKKINLVDEGPKACPVSGQPAKKDSWVIQRTAEEVYFCCDKCPAAFEKKNKLEAKDEGPKTCPVSGAPAKNEPGTSLVVNGEKVYFCCANCPKKYEKELGVVDKGPGKCPISGQAAKKDVSEIVVKSKVVYFCCDSCKAKYEKEHFKDGVVVAPPADKKAETGAPGASGAGSDSK